jgi:hypothetical protein
MCCWEGEEGDVLQAPTLPSPASQGRGGAAHASPLHNMRVSPLHSMRVSPLHSMRASPLRSMRLFGVSCNGGCDLAC